MANFGDAATQFMLGYQQAQQMKQENTRKQQEQDMQNKYYNSLIAEKERLAKDFVLTPEMQKQFGMAPTRTETVVAPIDRTGTEQPITGELPPVYAPQEKDIYEPMNIPSQYVSSVLGNIKSQTSNLSKESIQKNKLSADKLYKDELIKVANKRADNDFYIDNMKVGIDEKQFGLAQQKYNLALQSENYDEAYKLLTVYTKLSDDEKKNRIAEARTKIYSASVAAQAMAAGGDNAQFLVQQALRGGNVQQGGQTYDPANLVTAISGLLNKNQQETVSPAQPSTSFIDVNKMQPAQRAVLGFITTQTAQDDPVFKALALSVATQESNFNNSAVGDGGDSWGVMQINKPAHPDYDINKGKQDFQYNVGYGLNLLKSHYNRYLKAGKSPEEAAYFAARDYNGSGAKAENYAKQVIARIGGTPTGGASSDYIPQGAGGEGNPPPSPQPQINKTSSNETYVSWMKQAQIAPVKDLLTYSKIKTEVQKLVDSKQITEEQKQSILKSILLNSPNLQTKNKTIQMPAKQPFKIEVKQQQFAPRFDYNT